MGAGAKRRQSREGQGSHRTLAVLPRSTPPCKPTGPAPCLSASQPTLSRPYRHPRPRGSAPASRRHPSRRASGARAPIAAPSAPARRPPSLQHLRPGRYAFGARIPTFLRHRRPDRPSTSAPSRPSVPAHARLRACELPTPRPPSGTRAPTRRTSGIRIPTVAPRRPHPNLVRHPRSNRRPPPFRRLRPVLVARRELAKISAGRSSDRPPCGPKARHG